MSFSASPPPSGGYASSRAGPGARPTHGALPPLNLNMARGIGRGRGLPAGAGGTQGMLSPTHDILDGFDGAAGQQQERGLPQPPPSTSRAPISYSPNTLNRPLPSPIPSLDSNSPSPSPTANAFPFHLPRLPTSSSGFSLSSPTYSHASELPSSFSQPTITPRTGLRTQRTSSLLAGGSSGPQEVPLPPSHSTSNSSLSTISNNFDSARSSIRDPTSSVRSSTADNEPEMMVFSGPDMSRSSSKESVNAPAAGESRTLARDETVKRKKPNPLEDLIRTENLYVADLAVIIKRVAGAWSRSNFPPAALDGMFRCVEAVYRVNKGLLAKLNEIGPSPSSPKALGDLLMRWITDLDPAYTRYTTSFQSSFDLFIPVQSNPNLAPILSQLAWPSTLPPSSSSPSQVTLDTLFSLPIERIKYYKKLYSRLLKSTQEGRSDHDMLVGANEKLDQLEVNYQATKDRQVGEEHERMRPQVESARSSTREGEKSERSSGESSARYESDRFSSATNTTSTSTTNLSGPPRIEDLERRLNTDRTLDIFTMLPKKCKLQMCPPNLPFTRQIRAAADVTISFTPLSDPAKRLVIIRKAYIFLLTDLFLVCERMSTEERHHMQQQTNASGQGSQGPDMWLLYPPLAGKHLRVRDGDREGELEVMIMKKETLKIKTESTDAAEAWKVAFEEAIAFGSSQGMAAARSDSTSSHGTQALRSPLSPTNPAHQNIAPRPGSQPSSPLPPAPGGGSLPSPLSSGQSHEFRSSPEPSLLERPLPPPNQDQNVGMGLPGRQYDRSQQDAGRRAFSVGEVVAPPPRKQSTGLASSDGRQYQSSPTPPPIQGYPQQYDRQQSPLGDHPQNAYPQQQQQQHQQQPQQPYPPYPNGQAPFDPYQQQNNGYPTPPHQQMPGAPSLPPGAPGYPALQKSTSSRSEGSISSRTDRSSGYPNGYVPPLPGKEPPQMFNGGASYPTSRRTDPGRSSHISGGLLSPGGSIHRSRSAEGLHDGHYRLPSQALMGEERSSSAPGSSYGRNEDDSPPPSPVGGKHPESTIVVAQMRCKAFLQQHHSQWKSLGTAKLKVFVSMPSNTKQLVVESDKSDKKVFVSTIVLTDGVERVGKTGVAIELSDNGARTGIIYMLQMKTEQSATGLFDELLKGSDRDGRKLKTTSMH